MTDLSASGSLGEFRFDRAYNSTGTDWFDDLPLAGTPTPFGTIQDDTAQPEWTHNLLAMVAINGKLWSARDQYGYLHRFRSCTSVPCFAQPTPDNVSSPATLERTSSGFVLRLPDAHRLVYEAAFNPTDPSVPIPDGGTVQFGLRYYLTAVLTPAGAPSLTLTYQTPSGLTCPQGFSGTAAGVPYLYEAATPEMKVRFSYVKLGSQCVLRSLATVNPDAGTGATVAVYSYVAVNGAEQPGRLATAASALLEESYDYGSAFTRTKASFQTLSHAYTSGRVTTDTSVGESWSFTFDAGVCAVGSPNSCCNEVPRAMRGTSSTAQRGDGTSTSAGLTAEYLQLNNVGQADEPRFYQLTESCTVSGSCSPGTTRSEWACSTSSFPGYEKAFKNKRENWEVYAWATLDGGISPLERRGVSRGNSSMAGTDPLETETYSYVYGSGNQQLPSTTTRASVVSSGNNSIEKRWYDSNNRLAKTTHSGYTKAAITQSTEAKVIATFYATSRSCGATAGPDALGRTLEEHGPCFVSSETSSECSGSGYPITVREYWPATDITYGRKNRLKAVHRYVWGSEGCADAGSALSTTYDDYDPLGNARLVTDEAGNATTYSLDSAGRTLTRTKGGNTTSFAYDNEKLARITWPAGNVELFCYRTGSGTDVGCTGGTWTPQLQWKAKMSCTASGSGCASGATWSERVKYTHASDGTVSKEEYWSCPAGDCSGGSAGELRRVEQFSADAHRRPTWRRSGDTTGQFDSTSFFDRANNLAGVGLAFNDPPDWCGGPASGAADEPDSKLCAMLKYDRAERLASFTEYPSGGSGSGQSTCFGYNGNGDISRVTPGCTAGCNSDGTCGSLGLGHTTEYGWDDFGNLILVQAPWTAGSGSQGKGLTTYEHDALGNVLYTQNAEQYEAGEYFFYTYDALGRKTAAKVYQASGVNTLWRMTYDSAAAPSNCPSLSNTTGRLSRREDAYGLTLYSYDVEARVTKELRIKAPGTDCVTSDGTAEPTGYKDIHYSPHTFLSYDVNGNPASIELPHGRTVTYNYGSGSNRDRIASVDVTRREPGDSWSTKRLIDGVTWEPYGGLRRYQGKGSNVSFDGGSDFTVEYMLGDNASVAPSSVCSSTPPSPDAGDHTGRMRALFVTAGTSAALGGGSGDIYRRWYTHQADVPTRIESCLLGESTPRVSQYTYDNTLKLMSADGGYPNGPTGVEAFTFDTRGNRDSGFERGLTTGYAYVNKDRLSTLARSDGLTRTYQWDRAGRPASDGGFYFGPNGTGEKGFGFNYWYGWGVTFRATQIAGAWYNYAYDAYERRVTKQYPTGTSDEFFYDEGHQLLADRGMVDVATAGAHTLDEYVWLGGRPVAVVRSPYQLWSGYAHRYDDRRNDLCSRTGDGAQCGVYFIVTDALGTPVVMLDQNARVTGVNDADPFGYPNRGQLSAQTSQPYSDNQSGVSLGSYQLATSGTSSTVTTDTRVKFAVLELLPDGGDGVYLDDGTSTTPLLSGQPGGPAWTGWLGTSSGTQTVNVRFTSNSANHTAGGAVAEAFEYRRYQTSAAGPRFSPLRFPGQYHDAETDFFENWNRYYDPFAPRYLQPDPVIYRPAWVTAHTRRGHALPTYSYGLNNPVTNQDPSGLYVTADDCEGYFDAVRIALERAGCPKREESKGGGGACGKRDDRPDSCRNKILKRGGCDICEILPDGVGPLLSFKDRLVPTRPLNSEPDDEDPWATTSPAAANWTQVLREYCFDPSSLASILIHESMHACPGVTRIRDPAAEVYNKLYCGSQLP